MKYLRFIMDFLKDMKWKMVLFLLLAESATSLSSTYLQKLIINDAFVYKHNESLPILLLIFGFLIMLQSALSVIAPYVLVRNEYHIGQKLLRKILHCFYRFPLAFIREERTGRFVQNMTSDIQETSALIGFMTPRGVQQFIQAICLIIFVGIASPKILFCMLLVGVFYVISARYIGRLMKQANAKIQEERTNLAVHLEESISSTREIITFNRSEWEGEIYNAFFEKLYAAIIKEGKLFNRQMLFNAPVRYGVPFLIFFIGGYEMLQGKMTLGLFVIVLQFSNQLMECFNNLYKTTIDFISKLVFIDRIYELFKVGIGDNANLSLKEPIRSLVLENIDFFYGEDEVLKGLKLEFPIGKKIAIIGESGSGKSTIVHLLMRSYRPTNGRVVVNDQDLSQIRFEDWTSKINIVLQEPYLLADTIRTNVQFGREIDDLEMSSALVVSQMQQFISDLPNGLDEQAGERGIQLSGGQRQRLALARAIVNQPEILLLDEATSSLDLETERRLQEQLDERRENMTTIIVAHRLSTIQNADIIFVLHEGKLIEKGTHMELLKEGKIYPKLLMLHEDNKGKERNTKKVLLD